MITQEMIEIASAAYWAADARNGDRRLAKSTEPSVNPLRAAIESIYTQLIAEASPSAIAAEADTAKDETCPNCVSPYKCNGPHISEHPPHGYEAADRLAPIEARGAVTVPRKAYETVCAALGHISIGGLDDPRDYASRALHQAAELEAEFLRARESATAVEK